MVLVKDLLVALDNKALSIEISEDKERATLGGIDITKEQADKLCKNQFGWVSYVLNPFEIIEKTSKFTKALKRELKDEYIIDNTEVTFTNKRDSEYGRTFDRITLQCKNRFEYTVLYNMKSAGGAYVLYNYGKALPIQKFRTMKQLLAYIQKDDN